MPRAPAPFTSADIKRVLTAAKAAGVRVRVVIHKPGVMEIMMLDETETESHPIRREGQGWGKTGGKGVSAIRA